MAYWTLDNPPTWAPNATATDRGWEDGVTGELLVAIRNLANRRTTGGGAYSASFTTTDSKTKLKTGDVISLVVLFNEKITVDSASDSLSSLTISNGGSAYTTPPTIGFAGGAGTGAAATAVMGVHATVTIGAGGTGYTGTPTVAITGGGGTGATGTVAITGNAVSSITITAAGTGYTSVPTFTISGTGTGATATGKLKVVSGTVTAGGSGYTSAPTVSFTGGGGTGAAATAVLGSSATLGLTIGSNSRTATYAGTSGTNALTFNYTIVSGDSGNWTAIGSDITANGATFKDSDGTTDTVITGVGSLFPSTSGYAVDNTAPTASDVVIYGGAKFTTGNVIRFKVPFSEAVTVTGTPALDFDVNGTARQATYVETSASGTDVFFDYTVVAGDSCTATNFNLTGTITVGEGSILNASGLSAPLTGLAAESFIDTVYVNTGAAVAAPTVSGVALATATYKKGDSMPIVVTFSQRVAITGSPTFTFLINGVEKIATYDTGTGLTTIGFTYEVEEGDLATSSQVTYAANPISLNGGTIQNYSGVDATITKTAASFSGPVVNGVTATVSSSAFTGSAHPTYVTDDDISITLTYSKAITVSGTPRIVLGIGDFARYAEYASGTGTTDLVFTYTAVAEDIVSHAGYTYFQVASNDVDLNGGTLVDATGNSASVRFRRPSVTSITVNA